MKVTNFVSGAVSHRLYLLSVFAEGGGLLIKFVYSLLCSKFLMFFSDPLLFLLLDTYAINLISS